MGRPSIIIRSIQAIIEIINDPIRQRHLPTIRKISVISRLALVLAFSLSIIFFGTRSIEILRMSNLLASFDSGYSSKFWSKNMKKIVEHYEINLSESCSWQIREVLLGLNLELLDFVIYNNATYSNRSYYMEKNIEYVKRSLSCDPFRHALWVSLIKLSSFAIFDKSKIKSYIEVARYLSPYQSDDLRERVELYSSIVGKEYFAEMQPVISDMKNFSRSIFK